MDTPRIPAKASTTSKMLVPTVDCILHQNLPLASFNTCSQWNERSINRRLYRYDDNERRSIPYWSQMRRSQRTQRLSAVAKNRKCIVPIGVTSDVVTVFQTQNVVGTINNNSFLNNKIITSILEDQRGNSKLNNGSSILFTNNVNVLKTSQQQSLSPSSQDNEGKPSQEQLQRVLDCLSDDVCYVTYKVFYNYCPFLSKMFLK